MTEQLKLIPVLSTIVLLLLLLLAGEPVAALTYFSLSYFLLKLWSFVAP